MIHNDVLRSLRYMLDITDTKMAQIARSNGFKLSDADMASYLKKEDDKDFVHCPDEAMAHFLDGLVIFRRGRDESRPLPPIELPVSNNTILKKLRVAFELKDDDILALLKAVNFPVSKTELSALFRKVGHDNFRPCGDQLLRNFLKGLSQRIRG
ncbi:DUF1456 family protein [Pseudomonas putida CSV86]|uniref:DUF1456 family protein n=1 Tax=Pseudomonas bharatica CSV86 TaxID=1005395 RepID=L1M6F8_9PSED|nr:MULTISPECIES: DUF1456 family protein [Pseudomonas]MDG9881712.1 DUF1456 family protein [Pseudomonas sp. GD04058]NNJ17087.1 DUF1456 family protein [Pseudomonas bharatica CSV86]